MALNASKTHFVSTAYAPAAAVLDPATRRPFGRRAALGVLGAHCAFAPPALMRDGIVDDGPARDAQRRAEVLLLAKLRVRDRLAVLETTALGGLRYRAPYSDVPPAALNDLTRAVQTAVLGRPFTRTSTPLVASAVIGRNHLVHPPSLILYARATALFGAMKESASLRALVDDTARRYGRSAAALAASCCGPVGLLLRDLKAIGMTYVSASEVRAGNLSSGSVHNPLVDNGWAHEVRAALKRRDLAAIAKRVGYDGLQHGVNWARTHAYWADSSTPPDLTRAVLRIMTGTVTWDNSLAHASGGRVTPDCKACGEAPDSCEHMVTECQAYADLRSDCGFAAADAFEGMPDCLRLRGIVPAGCTTSAATVHALSPRMRGPRGALSV
eukprot:TRINITY_DN1611_c0_g2_i7.p1 TRINITY_DN1611_c0_g2~~TRINITY_DN1611_c0_g2_i7.p1  ORF type:complete len:384 (+),score=38.30 TRINITY_DN1611_c0_g2_i7:317-1468(+)